MRKLQIVSILVMLLLLCSCSPNEKSVVCCLLPNDEPLQISLPSSPTVLEPSTSDEWVMTTYMTELRWNTEDGEQERIQITLPAIQPTAGFAHEYNCNIKAWGEDLIADVCAAAGEASNINTSSVSFEAYLNEGVLSILLIEEFETGKCNYDVANFDVVSGRKLNTAELSRRWLDLDYPTFLWFSTQVVISDFKGDYYNPAFGDAYEEVFDVLSGEEKEQAKRYHFIKQSIPTDTFNLYHRSLFKNENGKVMMIYQGVLMSDDWQYGLSSTERVVNLSSQEIQWESIPQVDMLQELLTLQVGDRRYYPEYYSYILQMAFCDRPKEYILALETLSKEQIAQTINALAYCVDTDTSALIIWKCDALMVDSIMPDEVKIICNSIIDALA